MTDKVTRQRPQTTTFFEERRAEAESNRGRSAYQPNALPLGQTGSFACDSKRVTFIPCFKYPPRGSTCSAVWVLHDWCHVKLLPSRRVHCKLCDHAPRHFTSCKVGIHRVHAYLPVTCHQHLSVRCNLPPAPFAE